MSSVVSLEDLEERHPDDESRRRLFRLVSIVDILRESIITKSYKVPQAFHESINLTEYGRRIAEQLTRKGVTYPEGKVLCLLELAHSDFLVDVENINQEDLLSSISDQILKGLIKLPFIFGRALYDRFYDLHTGDSVYHLNSKETQELLDGMPQGVYQNFDVVTGPFGILQSQSLRFFAPDTDVPLRHCEEFTCDDIHMVSLATSYEAPINEHRAEIRKILEKECVKPSAWSTFIHKIGQKYAPLYADWAIEPLIPVIGDGLTDKEIKIVIAWLLDNTAGKLREVARICGLTGPAERIVAALDRASLMQLMLVCDDNSIATALDTLIFEEKIIIPPGEVRQAKVCEDFSFGAYRLRGEMSRYGVRVQANVGGVSSLRLRRLIEQMYRLDDEKDRQELEWRLRDQPADSLEARLELYTQSRSPNEMLKNLVLARKSNVIVASEALKLIEPVSENDNLLLNTILWKLGFLGSGEVDPHARFWRLHDQMLQLTRQSQLGQLTPDGDQIRGVAANYFVTLEELLDASLTFTTWALTSDHYANPKPFKYSPEVDRQAAFALLNENEGIENEYALTFNEKNSLYTLMRGFDRLSSLLKDRETRDEDFKRTSEQTPDWAETQSLQRFPFVHTVPYLDLLPDCRGAIQKGLKDISQRLVGASINDARNEWLHGRRTTANLDRLRAGLEAVRESVSLIEEYGFTRRQFWRVRSESDGSGRGTITLSDLHGREVAFFRPSPYAWLRLPQLGGPQYVMTSARFAEPSEALRFTVELDSDYTKMWSNFPLRPQVLRKKLSARRQTLEGGNSGLISE
ncbi:hypothetical protein [Streptosporangium sp. NPDC049304]|uniref:hypothetical protein n=1 Tax=Streptosporangium sp. NPDC049304 TaxID=3154830 RepID=UPI0034277BA0